MEKSRIDWEKDKSEVGDGEDLKKARKDGYIEKVSFLSKVDQKEYGVEKGIRNDARRDAHLKSMRKGKR